MYRSVFNERLKMSGDGRCVRRQRPGSWIEPATRQESDQQINSKMNFIFDLTAYIHSVLINRLRLLKRTYAQRLARFSTKGMFHCADKNSSGDEIANVNFYAVRP